MDLAIHLHWQPSEADNLEGHMLVKWLARANAISDQRASAQKSAMKKG